MATSRTDERAGDGAQDRTGDRPSRTRRFSVGYLLIGAVAATAAFGWAYVMAHVGQTPGIVPQTIAYRVISDSSVEISYSVAKPKNSKVRCVIQAIDAKFAEVGRTEIVLPTGIGHANRTQQLPTSARAHAAQVRDCARL